MGTTSALRAEDLPALPDPAEGYYELSEGELVQVPGAGKWHEFTKSKIAQILSVWNARQDLGLVLSESLFRLSDDTARVPDVAFFCDQNRFLGDSDDASDKAMIRVMPDLAIEVISDSEPAGKADQKLHQYLRAGILEVWQVFPGSKSVLIHTVHNSRRLEDDQELETHILPGFSVRVSKFFP